MSKSFDYCDVICERRFPILVMPQFMARTLVTSGLAFDKDWTADFGEHSIFNLQRRSQYENCFNTLRPINCGLFGY